MDGEPTFSRHLGESSVDMALCNVSVAVFLLHSCILGTIPRLYVFPFAKVSPRTSADLFTRKRLCDRKIGTEPLDSDQSELHVFARPQRADAHVLCGVASPPVLSHLEVQFILC